MEWEASWTTAKRKKIYEPKIQNICLAGFGLHLGFLLITIPTIQAQRPTTPTPLPRSLVSLRKRRKFCFEYKNTNSKFRSYLLCSSRVHFSFVHSRQFHFWCHRSLSQSMLRWWCMRWLLTQCISRQWIATHPSSCSKRRSSLGTASVEDWQTQKIETSNISLRSSILNFRSRKTRREANCDFDSLAKHFRRHSHSRMAKHDFSACA